MTQPDFSSQSPKRHINTTKIREYVANAFDKAESNQPAIYPGDTFKEFWVQNSAKSAYYLVTMDAAGIGRFEEMSCSCDAAKNDWPYCWHKAAVLNWVAARQKVVGFGRTLRNNDHTSYSVGTHSHQTEARAVPTRLKPALPHNFKPNPTPSICRDGRCELDANCPSYDICKDFHRRMGGAVTAATVVVIAFVPSTTPQTRPSPEPNEARCEYCGVRLTPANYGFSNRCKPCIQEKARKAEEDIYG